eukprot:CAMPEP_0195288426 /NCGR_PEP_ID=MMETSP0707-20130614/5097_1 /TAXON_ID=33640 /ORGANISM="Asterionellopsis glacialis, Strain CCMP134" /LENGTH=186 /DNA_ID=CAMNT_0040348293 /DNA_START=90 /DNA_END=650 /DNA_ORIENTATION=+
MDSQHYSQHLHSFMGMIVPGLWIGDLSSVQHLDALKNQSGNGSATSVTVISVLSSQSLIRFATDILINKYQETSIRIQHVVWELRDTPKASFLSDTLAKLLQGIDETISSGGTCLVHCAHGVSRSAALCAAWLISRTGLSLAEAMDRIRLGRPDANPNLGFIASLKTIEKRNDNRRDVIQHTHLKL